MTPSNSPPRIPSNSHQHPINATSPNNNNNITNSKNVPNNTNTNQQQECIRVLPSHLRHLYGKYPLKWTMTPKMCRSKGEVPVGNQTNDSNTNHDSSSDASSDSNITSDASIRTQQASLHQCQFCGKSILDYMVPHWHERQCAEMVLGQQGALAPGLDDDAGVMTAASNSTSTTGTTLEKMLQTTTAVSETTTHNSHHNATTASAAELPQSQPPNYGMRNGHHSSNPHALFRLLDSYDATTQMPYKKHYSSSSSSSGSSGNGNYAHAIGASSGSAMVDAILLEPLLQKLHGSLHRHRNETIGEALDEMAVLGYGHDSSDSSAANNASSTGRGRRRATRRRLNTNAAASMWNRSASSGGSDASSSNAHQNPTPLQDCEFEEEDDEADEEFRLEEMKVTSHALAPQKVDFAPAIVKGKQQQDEEEEQEHRKQSSLTVSTKKRRISRKRKRSSTGSTGSNSTIPPSTVGTPATPGVSPFRHAGSIHASKRMRHNSPRVSLSSMHKTLPFKLARIPKSRDFSVKDLYEYWDNYQHLEMDAARMLLERNQTRNNINHHDSQYQHSSVSSGESSIKGASADSSHSLLSSRQQQYIAAWADYMCDGWVEVLDQDGLVDLKTLTRGEFNTNALSKSQPSSKNCAVEHKQHEDMKQEKASSEEVTTHHQDRDNLLDEEEMEKDEQMEKEQKVDEKEAPVMDTTENTQIHAAPSPESPSDPSKRSKRATSPEPRVGRIRISPNLRSSRAAPSPESLPDPPKRSRRLISRKRRVGRIRTSPSLRSDHSTTETISKKEALSKSPSKLKMSLRSAVRPTWFTAPYDSSSSTDSSDYDSSDNDDTTSLSLPVSKEEALSKSPSKLKRSLRSSRRRRRR